MNKFNNPTEKIEFLRKYKLISKTSIDLPIFYYFFPKRNIPAICKIIGYEDVFGTWACITIKVNDEVINIHSDHFGEMQKRGRAFYKNASSIQNHKNDSGSYVVFDLETTGTNYKQDAIIEIAAIKCNDHEILEFNKLVKTESIVPVNITLLTGITNEMLCDADSIEIVLPEFIKFIGNCKLVGHNIRTFDIRFIHKACRDLRIPEITNELIDTLQISKKSYLTSLIINCQLYVNITKLITPMHTGLADCYMCNECYKYLSGNNDPQDIEISTDDLADDD